MPTAFRLTTCSVVLAAGFLLHAQSPSATVRRANATGQCRDGTYSTAAGKAGACHGHNGVKDWYAAAIPAKVASPATPSETAPSQSPAPQNSATTPAAAPSPANQTAPIPTAAPAKSSAAKGPKANLAATPTAAGGAPNLVWVNTASNVYHCYGTDFYGKTKAGSYMTEAEAKSKGAHGNRGTTCTK